MDRDEITKMIDSFPSWFYEFDLKGISTPARAEGALIKNVQRKDYFFDPLVNLLGGSLKGKRVLDIGCNAGFWSLQAIESGCDFVMGIDGRQMHIDQANFVFKVKEIEENRYKFVAGNIFDVDLQEFGTFDIVICLAMFHHVSKHIELLEKITEINDDILLLETRLSRIPGAYMVIQQESLNDVAMAVDYSLTMTPTKQAVFSMVQQFGYTASMLRPNSRHQSGEPHYKAGRRRAFLCSKKTDCSKLPAEVEKVDRRSELMDVVGLGAQWLRRRIPGLR
jgi:tRNA (mo5U34)-methyltransferase